MSTAWTVAGVGDLDLNGGVCAFGRIDKAITALLAGDVQALSPGVTTLSPCRFYAPMPGNTPNLNVLHLYDRPELYNELDGIRTDTPQQRERARDFSVETVEMQHRPPGMSLNL